MKLFSWLRWDLQSPWVKSGLTTTAVGFYTLTFVLLYPHLGAAVAALTVLPVALIAWFFGGRAGFFAALVSLPLNTLLLNLAGEPGWDAAIRRGAIPGTFATLMIALLVGHVRALSDRLRQSEAGARQLSDAAFEALVIHDQGRVLDVNEAFCRMYGYERSEVIGKAALELTAPGYRDLVRQKIEFGATSPYEGLALRKDGSSFQAEVVGRPMTYRGRIVRVTAIRDITERRQGLEVAEHERHLLRTVIDNLPHRIFYKDTQGRYVLINSTLARVYHLKSVDEAMGKSVFDFYPSALAAKYHADDLGVTGSGHPLVIREESSLDEHGNTVWLFTNKVPVRDSHDQVIGLIGISIDLTERKQTEQALRVSEARLSEVVRAGNIGIFDHDHTSDTHYWSPEQRNIYGWGPEEEVTIPAFLQVLHPEDRERIAAAMKRAHDPRGDGAFDVEHRIFNRSGEIRWLSVRSRTFFEGEGSARHPVRTVGATVDITDRKQAEAQQLELAFAQEKAEFLKGFLATVSHDLKTPLSVINSTLYLLQKLTDPEVQKDKMQVIKTQTVRLGKLIEDILMMSQLESVPEFEFEPLDINPLLHNIELDFHSIAEKKRLMICLKLAENLPCVRADSESISRAMVNLIENALTYSPEGGTVSVQTSLQDEDVVVEINDTGIGISEADLPYIFDRFYRADKARSTYTGGTGLGLAIVKKIIEMHNGSIEVESHLGVGSSFRVRLPIFQHHAMS